jgi:hypothetical protein
VKANSIVKLDRPERSELPAADSQLVAEEGLC